MILKEATFESEIIGGKKTTDFRINTDSAIIFEILRSKMYANPIAAICREILTNARDANIEADKRDVPIEIELEEADPNITPGGCNLHIRDSGLGIHPDRMYGIFIEYGASSKRDTNEQAGAFGLGAKTPFAYADQFTITTVCDVGEKRQKFVYTALIDSSKKGQITQLSRANTSLPTGTTIAIPINQKDKQTFLNECFTVTGYWGVKPKFVGDEIYLPAVKERVLAVNNYTIYKSTRYIDNGIIILIDEIPYKLQDNLCKNTIRLDNFTLTLPFKIGELSISANREQLHYDADTIAKIDARLAEVRQDLKKQIFDDITTSPTYLDACIRYSQYKYDYLNILTEYCKLNDVKLTQLFNGKELIDTLCLNCHFIATVNQNDQSRRLSWQRNKILTDIFKHTYFTNLQRQLLRKNEVIYDQHKIKSFILIAPKSYICTPEEIKNFTQEDQAKHEAAQTTFLDEQAKEYANIVSLLDPKNYDIIPVERTSRQKTDKAAIDPKTIPTKIFYPHNITISETYYRQLDDKRKIVINGIDKKQQLIIIPVENIRSDVDDDTVIKSRLISGVYTNVTFLLINDRFIRYLEKPLLLDDVAAYLIKHKRSKLRRFIVNLYIHQQGETTYVIRRLKDKGIWDIVLKHPIIPEKTRKLYSLCNTLWQQNDNNEQYTYSYDELASLAKIHLNGKFNAALKNATQQLNDFMNNHPLFELAYQYGYHKTDKLSQELTLYFDCLLQGIKND